MLAELGVPDQPMMEWDKARVLNQWLLQTRRVSQDDLIIADSFWAQGLEHLPMCISHQHGNWSHTTKADVEAGVPPEFPMHAAVQLEFRKRYLNAGRKLTSVSMFISDQMYIQWGFPSDVINNGIDLETYKPVVPMSNWTDSRLIIHGVTTANKGFDHIQAVKEAFPKDQVLSLDEAAKFLELEKPAALANADVVLHPSAHEGNSYFVLESLACGRPIVSYDVGLMYQAKQMGQQEVVGEVLPRMYRNPQATVEGVRRLLQRVQDKDKTLRPREFAQRFSVEAFRDNWKVYIQRQFGELPCFASA